jgi:hypothetical protein
MARILQGKFLVDTTVSFQRILDLPEPLRSASIINASTVTISIALGSNDVRFFDAPASTTIDIEPWDIEGINPGDEVIIITKLSFTAPSTAPAGTSFNIVAFLARKNLGGRISSPLKSQ